MARKHVAFRQAVVKVLVERQHEHEANPDVVSQGMNTLQIRERLVDLGFGRIMPPNNGMGRAIKTTPGVEIIGSERTGSTYTRQQKVWDIDETKFNKWRRDLVD
jgi:hypothetical protein|tara:strand:- start:214 stop:525 length:312 start_codon:yes stop_codon:yes gene_type:complete